MRVGRGNAGIVDPQQRTGRRWAGRIFLLLFLVLFSLPFLPRLFPDGVRIETSREYEGLLHVPQEGMRFASFQRASLLRENLSAAPGSPWKVESFCVGAAEDAERAIDGALRRAPPESGGRKSLWIRFVAERRFGAWDCLNRTRRRKLTVGDLLRVQKVVAVRPLGCASSDFIRGGLRCPAPPRPSAPVLLEDEAGTLYPEGALRRGAEGTTRIRLLVSGNDIMGCDILESSNDADLDAGACELMRTHPHLIRPGRQAPGYATGVREVSQQIVWRLPPDSETRP